MLIHSYLTDGFFTFGKAFLLSFKQHHGESMPVFLTTRDLSEEQIDELYSIYDNLIVSNEKIDMERLSDRTGIGIKRLRKLKWQVENIHVKRESVIWKQFISVEDRYRNSLDDAFSIAGDYLIHMDADSYIKKPLDPLFELVKNNDVSAIFKLGQKKIRLRIFACLLGFKVGQGAQTFLETWRKHIDAIPLIKKPQGYGQTSFYNAYRELEKSGIKWGRIPRPFVQPGFKSNAFIIQGNNGRRKDRVAKEFEARLR